MEWEEKDKLFRAGYDMFQKMRQDYHNAVIIAEFHQDDSDASIDYNGYVITEQIVLGLSRTTRNHIPELRIACLASDIPEIKTLSTAGSETVHREFNDVYLGKNRYHTGWIVRKIAISELPTCFYMTLANNGDFVIG